ncbi:MAG: hypothetical protein JXR83_22050 [Deltaproteobacteria bacterium]|nr:hypothetical protein [Deltaproteobacteria bacterium]
MEWQGFTADDFALYRPERRTSAMYTLKRRAVKDKLRALEECLRSALGASLDGLAAEFSDDSPSLVNHHCVDRQWLCWLRDAAAQQRLRSLLDKIKLTAPDALDVAAHHKHAHLALVVDERGVEVGLRLHRRASVDRENLAARLKEGWARDGLARLIGRCGEGALFGACDGRELPTVAAAAASAEAMATLADEAAGREWLAVCALTPADDAVAAGAALAESCGQRLHALAEIYRFCAWTPDNDHIAARKAIKEAGTGQQKSGFKKGDRVRILAGLWSGRSGTVEEIDRKGGLKVLVGLVAVKVDVSEVAPVES